MDIKQIEYTECYFNGTVDFGRKSVLSFPCNGDKLDQIILKISLPFLPDNLRYKKKDLIYKLIAEIALEIGGFVFFSYSGQELKKIDTIQNKLDKKQKLIDLDRSIIYYPIDLSKIFTTINPEGIRLIDLVFSEVKFYLRLNDISSIIQPEKCCFKQRNLLKDIVLENASLLARYIHNNEPSSRPFHYQNLISWLGQTFILSPNGEQIIEDRKRSLLSSLVLRYSTEEANYNVKINIHPERHQCKIKKIAIFVSPKKCIKEIESCFLKQNTTIISDNLLSFERKALDCYNNNVELQENIFITSCSFPFSSHNELGLEILLKKNFDKQNVISLTIIFEIERQIHYSQGLVGFSFI